tara:strand:- start:60 stop:203 length:144 start_codon:yes stop_codon:yes gene_type:complete
MISIAAKKILSQAGMLSPMKDQLTSAQLPEPEVIATIKSQTGKFSVM